MKEEKQETQIKASLWSKFCRWVGSLSIQFKIFLISLLILILGFVFVNISDNKDVIKALEESKRRTEDKLKSISLYEGRLDGYESAVDDLEEEIQNTNSKIKEITTEKPENLSLDEFFDKRV